MNLVCSASRGKMFFFVAILIFLRIEIVTLLIIPNVMQQPNATAGPLMTGSIAQLSSGLSAASPAVNAPQVPPGDVLKSLLGSVTKPLASPPNSAGNPVVQPVQSYPFVPKQNSPINAGDWDKRLENDVWPNRTTANLYAYYLEAFHEAKAFYNRRMPTYEEEKKAFLHYVKKTHDNIERDIEEKLGVKAAVEVAHIAGVRTPTGANSKVSSIGPVSGIRTVSPSPVRPSLGNAQRPKVPVQNMVTTLGPQKPSKQDSLGPSIPNKPFIFKDKAIDKKEQSSSLQPSSSSFSASTKATMPSKGSTPSMTGSSSQNGSQSSQATKADSTAAATNAPKARAPLSM